MSQLRGLEGCDIDKGPPNVNRKFSLAQVNINYYSPDIEILGKVEYGLLRRKVSVESPHHQP